LRKDKSIANKQWAICKGVTSVGYSKMKS